MGPASSGDAVSRLKSLIGGTLGVLLGIACGSNLGRSIAPPRVTIGAWTYEGTWDKEYVAAVFKGVPYAQAPVEELRWRPPLPFSYSPASGFEPAMVGGPHAPLPATAYAPGCIQSGGNVSWSRRIAEAFGANPLVIPSLIHISEDCLYLNVWTPSLPSSSQLPPAIDERTHSASGTPVMVWIYGGGNSNGTTAEIPYDGANLASHGVVVVTVSYRVGPFGFLAHPALSAETTNGSSGNYGLLDQIEALRWVQRYVALFGGDPNNVTMFGESAGGADIISLMTSPLTDGLFHRAISQSGGFYGYQSQSEAFDAGTKLAAALGVDSIDATAERPSGADLAIAKALRAKNAHEVLRTWEVSGSPGVGNPNIDGWVLPDVTARMFAQGRVLDVPLLTGINAHEWSLFHDLEASENLNKYRRELHRYWGPLTDRAAELYAVSAPNEVRSAVIRWRGDSEFLCPTLFQARSMGQLSSAAWLYEFTRTLPGSLRSGLGSFHAAEIAYVFDNLSYEHWLPYESVDTELANAMSAYWVHFARTGDPNGGGLPAWPEYDSGSQEYLELGERIVPRAGLRTEACALWEARLRQQLNLK